MQASAPASRLGEITVEVIPAMKTLSLPMRGSFTQIPAAIGEVMALAMAQGAVRGEPFGVYYNTPGEVAEDALSWDVGVPVAPNTRAEAPFVLRDEPQMQAAVVVYTGPYDQMGPSYDQLFAWIASEGYTIAGPPQEQWLDDPHTVGPEKTRTRIVVPVSGT